MCGCQTSSFWKIKHKGKLQSLSDLEQFKDKSDTSRNSQVKALRRGVKVELCTGCSRNLGCQWYMLLSLSSPRSQVREGVKQSLTLEETGWWPHLRSRHEKDSPRNQHSYQGNQHFPPKTILCQLPRWVNLKNQRHQWRKETKKLYLIRQAS